MGTVDIFSEVQVQIPKRKKEMSQKYQKQTPKTRKGKQSLLHNAGKYRREGKYGKGKYWRRSLQPEKKLELDFGRGNA